MRTDCLTIRSLFLFFLITGICLSQIGCEKRVVDEKFSAVEGFVKDSLTEIGIVGADVFFDGDSLVFNIKTDSTGYYTIGFLGGSVEVRVTVKAQGYKTQVKTTMLIPDHKQRLDFFLVKE